MATAISSLLLFTALPLASAQPPTVLDPDNFGSCPPLTLEDLGDTESLTEFEGLVVGALQGIEISIPAAVRILDYRVLCASSGLRRNTSNSVSVLVSFECRGDTCQGRTPSEVVNSTEQFDFNCTRDFRGEFSYLSGMFQGVTRQESPLGNLSSGGGGEEEVLEDRCGLCLNPSRDVGLPADPVTHCIACAAECDEGQRRCVGTGPNQCCNWYLNDTCVATCPAPLVGDTTTYDCGCPGLLLENGAITYSERLLIGSEARHACNDGFVLSQPCTNIRTCTLDGWEGSEYTCLCT